LNELSANSGSGASAPFLSRFRIGPRLAAGFILILLLMAARMGVSVWQFREAQADANRRAAADGELIAVLRFQASLRSFYTRLDELAHLEDKKEVLAESDGLGRRLMDDGDRLETLFRGLPTGSTISTQVLQTVKTVQSEMPEHLAVLRDLASAGDWPAVRVRLEQQILPLAALSDDLVRDVDQDVTTERAKATASIAQAQSEMIRSLMVSGAVMLLIAAWLGVAITRSITRPLRGLEEASHAVAMGDFRPQIAVRGEDELAQLGGVFNGMVVKLGRLYDDLRRREADLRESEKEMRQLIESVPMHVFVVGPDGTGEYANKVVLDYYGASLEEWRKPGFDLLAIHEEDRARYVTDLQRGLAGTVPFETEARILRKDGLYRWFFKRFNPMRDDVGKVVRWSVARTDIEDAKQEAERTQSENLALREEVNRSASGEILGSSDNVHKVLGEIARVAPTDSTVLILGETGTGKELVARAIHKQSRRAPRAFIRVNCAAIPQSLISSELFGHEKGAFTGAVQRRLGRFEAANGGTIFLDEIGDLPAETQVALLRVLQEREFERVGSNQPIKVDVRILTATNRDLRAAVAAGIFRQDLFYRLNVFPIQLAPLRERRDDIPLLVEYFIERYASKGGKRIRHIKRSAFEMLQSYEWPGNVRELQNVVERAVLLCDGDTLSVDEAWFRQEMGKKSAQAANVVLRGLGRLQSNEERELIEGALADSGGQVSGPSGAAARLGIPRQTLESKIARLGIDKRKYTIN
jgi:formate hydrogenlyase transcriptional activator